MADEKEQGKDASKKGRPDRDISSDSGLGNLPPLSDFDSKSGLGTSSDAGLPPLGGIDDDGGLPPISDIDIETPAPTGGNIRPTPPGFDTPTPSDLFSSGHAPLDTPERSAAGTGFQDLAADSDFSPETPEIGPGPSAGVDSNMDTPMFDSAFGGGDSGFAATVQTPAPTQAMETPIFGGSQGPRGGAQAGFDQGGFGGGFDFGGGTPAPDFSPDTDMQQPAAVAPVPAAPKAAKKGGGNKALAPVLLVAGLVIGIAIGPLVLSFLPFQLPLPNPTQAQLDTANAKIAQLNRDLEEYRKIPKGNQFTVSPEDLSKLEENIRTKNAELTEITSRLESVTTDLNDKQTQLAGIQEDIAAKTEEFVTAQEMFEDLQNETAIVQARQKGLLAEVERLTSHVGELEDANLRRVATKEALEHAVDRLVIQIKEGMPLTPEKYAHAQRLAAVEDLRNKVGEAKWVTPALQDAYTALYLKELEIAAANEYFFARIPVTDEFGNRTQKYAECLMQGNWSVKYRTLDGKNIGIFTNLSTPQDPVWGFKEDLPVRVQKAIEEDIVAARVPGWEDKVKVLAQKQLAVQESSALQRNFESL